MAAKGDEFQHWVYEHHDAPTERKQIWRELEKKYLPSLDYDNFNLYNRGGSWLNDPFYFRYPFYYIDYGLAYVCAIQLWIRSLQDWDKAWNDYLKIGKLGGSKSFLELIKIADLKSPFEEGSIKSIIGPIKNWLDNVEDDKL
jgi:oligoendopeptidase F